MEINGRVIKYGNNVNTDVIIPSKYLVYTDPLALAAHAMEGLDPAFATKIATRTIVVAGTNFGCGSSREQAPLALKHAGVHCVVADSFARIFYRNAVNIGLPVLECTRIGSTVQDGDALHVNLETGVVEDLSLGVRLTATPIPAFIREIMEKGLIEYIKAKK
jgi:3-isopropylmalate/(R)-2-methylmalate dehydratase small subunit